MRALFLVLAACGAAPRQLEPKPVETEWCFRLRGRVWSDGLETGRVCLHDRPTCDYVRARAIQFGPFARITQVGYCGGAR